MPGDEWQKFANLRLLYRLHVTHPGKKLLFMGGEFGQRREWQHDESLEWHVLEYPLHAGVQRWITDLNHLYRETAALHQLDFSKAGFQWVDCNDADVSVICFLRRDTAGSPVLVACNFTPVPRENYRVGVPRGGHMERAAQQRCLRLRRQRPGKPRGARGAGHRIPRLRAFPQPALAAARGRDPHAPVAGATTHRTRACRSG